MSELDLAWLCKVRVVIGRLGEMDVHRWWNTDGQLGPYGARMLSRGLPRTHYFAQAKSVFAVAAHRSLQVFNPPNCSTLWHLTGAVEDEFDSKWEAWLDDSVNWRPFFEEVAAVGVATVPSVLASLGLVSEEEIRESEELLRRSDSNNAVPLPNVFARTRQCVSLLALGHRLSDTGDLRVPYIVRNSA
ncbi:BrxE family protein [Rhizobium laguerreae]|uniref:BrxE family protein n=1 Tax=Rhizobium laguerreae TaxID=1076926 RepID=UPI001C9276A2|nr:BrxE family protein [Rhizobium laguerreae]MBY3465667.1 BrxE family protein [Rhizobium laguerreae]